jgi:hypothetical protein
VRWPAQNAPALVYRSLEGFPDAVSAASCLSTLVIILGRFLANVLFGQVALGMVGQMPYGGSKFLQRFPGVLDPSQLSMKCLCQVVITVAILEHRSNNFEFCPTGVAMCRMCAAVSFKTAIKYAVLSPGVQPLCYTSRAKFNL